MKHQLTFAILLLAALTSAFAAEDSQPVPNTSDTATVAADGATPIVEQKPLRFLLGAGLTFGGDTLGTMTYSDGSTDSIKAGDKLMFYGGMDYRLNETISLQGTLGYHFDTTKKATNGEATFSRIPLELLAYYHIADAFRLGGGIRYVSSPKIEGTGMASGANESFDNTVGLIIEGEYMKGRGGIKVRHVIEKYQLSGSPVSIDGSHFGVLINLYF